MSYWYEFEELQALDDQILNALEADAVLNADNTEFEVSRDHVTLRATWHANPEVDNGE